MLLVVALPVCSLVLRLKGEAVPLSISPRRARSPTAVEALLLE
jgi:hypothetical protein